MAACGKVTRARARRSARASESKELRSIFSEQAARSSFGSQRLEDDAVRVSPYSRPLCGERSARPRGDTRCGVDGVAWRCRMRVALCAKIALEARSTLQYPVLYVQRYAIYTRSQYVTNKRFLARMSRAPATIPVLTTTRRSRPG